MVRDLALSMRKDFSRSQSQSIEKSIPYKKLTLSLIWITKAGRCLLLNRVTLTV